MANETLYADLSDSRIAAILSGNYLRYLAAREALGQSPALVYAGDARGSGSAAIKLAHYAIDGYTLPAATNDGAAVGNTVLVDTVTTVTVARYSKAYTPSDLARITDPHGVLSWERFAEDAFISGQVNLTSLVAALMGGFSNVVGTSGSNMTLANFLEAKRQLSVANVPGPYLSILHPQQFHDLLSDIALSVAGSAQWNPAAPGLVGGVGNGYVGELYGVQIFTSTLVPTANSGADRAGGMFGRGAVAWADATPVVDDPVNQVLIGGKVLFEKSRNAAAGLSSWVMHQYVGVAEAIDAAGVAIITDA